MSNSYKNWYNRNMKRIRIQIETKRKRIGSRSWVWPPPEELKAGAMNEVLGLVAVRSWMNWCEGHSADYFTTREEAFEHYQQREPEVNAEGGDLPPQQAQGGWGPRSFQANQDAQQDSGNGYQAHEGVSQACTSGCQTLTTDLRKDNENLHLMVTSLRSSMKEEVEARIKAETERDSNQIEATGFGRELDNYKAMLCTAKTEKADVASEKCKLEMLLYSAKREVDDLRAKNKELLNKNSNLVRNLQSAKQREDAWKEQEKKYKELIKGGSVKELSEFAPPTKRIKMGVPLPSKPGPSLIPSEHSQPGPSHKSGRTGPSVLQQEEITCLKTSRGKTTRASRLRGGERKTETVSRRAVVPPPILDQGGGSKANAPMQAAGVVPPAQQSGSMSWFSPGGGVRSIRPPSEKRC